MKDVLVTYGFEMLFELSKSYCTWEYCVQYRETDANFVMRMLEHEGIWFWFDHKAGSHALVMTDDISSAGPAPGCASLPYRSSAQGNPNEDFVSEWHAAGAVTSGDYAHNKFQIFDYPGSYYEAGEGNSYAQVRMDELHSPHQRAGGQASARGRAEGKLREDPITDRTEFQDSKGNWHDIAEADMSHHPKDAVTWWNETGHKYGARSPEVRKWMLDSDNYTLDHYSLNRSAGAKLTETYRPPL